MKTKTIAILAVLSTVFVTVVCDEESKGPVGPVPGEFTDPAFETCIREALEIPGAEITEDDLLTLIHLECQDRGITALGGIEFCANLQTLSVWENQIADLTPLAELAQLTELQAGNNLVADLTPIAGMTGLERLGLSVNEITDVGPLAGLTGLEWLNLDANLITDVSSLSGLSSLVWLTVERNSIADVSPLDSLIDGGCVVYTEYQGESSKGPAGPGVLPLSGSADDGAPVRVLVPGSLEAVADGDDGLALRCDADGETHPVRWDSIGDLHRIDDALVYETPDRQVVVGELADGRATLCEGPFAEVCTVSVGAKHEIGSRLDAADGESPPPVLTAALALEPAPEDVFDGAHPYNGDDYGAVDERLLPYALASPNQYDAGSCLYMSTTGAAEVLMNQHVPLEEIEYLGDTDLSERFLMNATTYVPQTEMRWTLSDLVFAYNHLGGSMLDRDYPMATALDGEYVVVSYSWNNDLPSDWEDQLVATPWFERTVVFLDPLKNDNSQWNVGLMDDTTVAQIKYLLRTKQAPLLVVYNHYLYWHSALIVGYDDTVETSGCPLVEDMQDYFVSEGFASYSNKVENHKDDLGGCTDMGIFYVRDSIYPGGEEEPVYQYGGPYPYTAKYSKRIIERTYNWVKFLSNHVYVIYRG
jgi:hypothetical protein